MTVVWPVHFGAFSLSHTLHIFSPDQQNVTQSFLRPTSFDDELPGNIDVLGCPLLVGLPL